MADGSLIDDDSLFTPGALKFAVRSLFLVLSQKLTHSDCVALSEFLVRSRIVFLSRAVTRSYFMVLSALLTRSQQLVLFLLVTRSAFCGSLTGCDSFSISGSL